MRDAFRRRPHRDDGFGLIELIVAMTLMAIVLMALAPFLVNAFKATAINIRIAGATEVVNQRIDLAQSRTHTSSCEAFDTFVTNNALSADEVDGGSRNIVYQLTYAVTDSDKIPFNVDSCNLAVNDPQREAKTYYVHVVATDKKDDTQLAQAKTWVAVPGFGS